MNKTIEALLCGYVLFDVNGRRFLRYNSAMAESKSIPGNVEFKVLHIFQGWEYFLIRRTIGE